MTPTATPSEPLPTSPNINPDHSNDAGTRVNLIAPLDHSEDRGAVNRHAETPHQPLYRSPVGSVSDEPNDPGQTSGSARIRRRLVGKPFRKDPLSALVIAAPPAGQPRLDLDRHSLHREIMGRSRRDRQYELCRETDRVRQVGQAASPRPLTETIQPVSFHSTPSTSWFGAGLHNPAFLIPADAAYRHNAQRQTILHRDHARS